MTTAAGRLQRFLGTQVTALHPAKSYSLKVEYGDSLFVAPSHHPRNSAQDATTVQ
jgi:hypothetical protein